MSRLDGERTHLLSNENGGQGGRSQQMDDDLLNKDIYYDSFPRTGSPDDEDNNYLGEENSSIQSTGNESKDPGPMKTYKRRWYILIMYSLFALAQNGLWNTWGPISASSEEAFGWHDSTIAWLNNWGPISYILLGLFFPWLLQVKVVFEKATSKQTSAPTKQAFPAFYFSFYTSLMHAGHFCIGASGPVAMGAIPALSAIWFPPQERVTATALGTSIGMFGVALSFVLGGF
ncbi:disrupted in renal carcinoma protein 2-like protein [Elysia marginata]|uniref:Disrupted in renal carcinoma protein 2-like protein n=1 Tax=Elysia marginata TaxID=1093978 RepID=A0AAV4FZF8_9GAST|nr:disrupted in renal carcinoma protein 2-like protein [Elysia marginata]